MRASELDYLEAVIGRSKERRRSFFGPRKTTAAEAAEAVLVAFAPTMLAEIKVLRTALDGPAHTNGDRGSAA